RNTFPDGKIVRIAAEAAVKNRAIHKKANIDCKQKAQLLLCNRFDVSHANKPWGKGEKISSTPFLQWEYQDKMPE
ncbi:MAG: hypothetical protein E7G33_20690, partial [Bacteroides sp.]|nr:hypothetical protein [Bacteroides sp.]